MVGWLAVAWVGLAVLVAAAWSRLRRAGTPPPPPEVAHFIERLRAELRDRPEARWCGWVPGRFSAILAVKGQETPVPLMPLFHQWSAFPDAFSQIVDRLLSEVEAEGLERATDHGFADVATSILPQVKSERWLWENSPAFGDAAIVHRKLGADLVTCYVIDDAWTMLFVCQEHLRRWGRSEDDLYHLATRNLLRLAGTATCSPRPGDDPVLVSTGDGYDAARLLLLDPDDVEGLLVAVPERDVLWLGAGTPQDQLAELMALNAEQSARSAHPVSQRVYRVHRGELEPLGETVR